ncbi:hypothetical protein CKO27_10570 [Thiocystis violacea]|nr:hypothetical protein [Thiocystis violacea]
MRRLFSIWKQRRSCMAGPDESLELEELIATIAKHHGVAVGKDDPILIVHTMIRHLLNDSARAQGEALQGFQAELEAASARWGEGQKTVAERTLTAAVTASTGKVHEISENAGLAIRREVQGALRQQQSLLVQVRRTAWMSLTASVIALTAVSALTLGLLL